MRVATYNIQYWTGMDRIQDPGRTLKVLSEMEPDIVALQEVLHPWPPEEPALEKAAQMLQGTFVFAEVWAVGDLPGISAPMGLAIISRYPIIAHATHRLTHSGPGQPRRLLEVRVELPDGTPFTVYATHLEWRSERPREEQVRSLLLWTTRDRGRPHILLGDFNTVHPEDVRRFEEAGGRWLEFVAEVEEEFPQAPRDPRALRPLLNVGYVDAFLAVGAGEGRTYTTERPLLRLDYCFVNPVLRSSLRTARRWDTELARWASDHYPVLVELAWPFDNPVE